MNNTLSLVTGVALAASLLAGPALAKTKLTKVRGHVIRIEQQVRSETAGSFDRLTIRTRQGEEMRLRLGDGGQCPTCYRVGDEIRARVRLEGGHGNECTVQKMQLRRNGRIYDFTFEGNKMVHHRERGHHRGHHGSGSRPGRGGRGGNGG